MQSRSKAATLKGKVALGCRLLPARKPDKRPALKERTPLLLLVLLLVLVMLCGCKHNESRAADRNSPEEGLGASGTWVEQTFPEVGTFLLPEGWHVTQGAYPSAYGDQYYHMVRARRDREDEDRGLLSIDISPSHPRLWRKALVTHVESRIKTLGTLGPTRVSEPGPTMDDLPYLAEQRVVSVASELKTVFRVFRQKSRVVTVAFTAGNAYFDEEAASATVHRASEALLLHLPIFRLEKPNLADLRERVIGDTLTARVPASWRVIRHREEQTLVPAETFELTPPDPDMADDPPTLSLSLVRLSLLGPDVEIEAVAVPSSGGNMAATQHSSATVFEVDDDTLGAARMTRVGGDLLTITYAAPDYLFDVKTALDLLERVAASVSLFAVR